MDPKKTNPAVFQKAKDALDTSFSNKQLKATTALCPPASPCEKPTKSPKGGNTTVQVDQKSKKITIRSKLEYSGPDASDAYAKYAKKEIEKTWVGSMQLNNEKYSIETVIDTKVNSTGKPTPGYDQIAVDSKTGRMSQTLFGGKPGGNQTPGAMDPTVRRISHEYGHTLGLSDEYHDAPNGAGSVKDDPKKLNNIMAETWADDKGIMPHPHTDHFEKVLKNYGCK